MLGQSDLFHQLAPNASGYGYIEAWGGKGLVLGLGLVAMIVFWVSDWIKGGFA